MLWRQWPSPTAYTARSHSTALPCVRHMQRPSGWLESGKRVALPFFCSPPPPDRAAFCVGFVPKALPAPFFFTHVAAAFRRPTQCPIRPTPTLCLRMRAPILESALGPACSLPLVCVCVCVCVQCG